MECEHRKEKTRCAACGGGSICPHQILRQSCSICEPGQSWSRYKRSAEGRKIPFLLTEQQFAEITRNVCGYCGVYGEPRGLDRVDNRLSYSVQNCVAACSKCNFAKRFMSKFEFLDWIQRVARYQDA